MLRHCTGIALLIMFSGSCPTEAQHHHGHHGGMYGPYSYPVSQGHPIGSGTSHGYHGHHRDYVPVFVATPILVTTPLQPLPPPVPTVSVTPIVFQNPNTLPIDPAKQPAKPSTAAGRLKCLEYLSRGDEKLRKQLWAQAYISYRSGTDAAGDQGEAHFRLGFVYTAMQYYPSAIREFKRGLFLTRELAASGIRMSQLFGPDSEIVRISILSKVADWVREDTNDPDRLFLLGLLLHYEDDPRRVEVLQAARSVASGDDEHIKALLAQPNGLPPAKVLLQNLPLLPAPPKLDLAKQDVAVPKADLIPPLHFVPQPPPSIDIPVLFEKPVPLKIPNPVPQKA